mmetsp:Transcript_23890/g.61345  ORF Transcript_23890/g.61345 Transcript_23890/m.61345 type:complete len:211 (-) Transcript_23890:6-638(-)
MQLAPKVLPHGARLVHVLGADLVAGAHAVGAPVPVVGHHSHHSWVHPCPFNVLSGVRGGELLIAVLVAHGVVLGGKGARHEDDGLVGEQLGVDVAVVEAAGLRHVLRVGPKVVAVGGEPGDGSGQLEVFEAALELRQPVLQGRPRLVEPDHGAREVVPHGRGDRLQVAWGKPVPDELVPQVDAEDGAAGQQPVHCALDSLPAAASGGHLY